MYLLSNGEEGLHATLKRCLEIPQEQNLINDTIEQPIEEPVKKRRRKQSSQTVSVTARSVFQHLGCQSTAELNSSNKNRTLYNRFKEQLLTEGNIIWRYHDDLEDICAMTDYNSTTGLLLPQSFAHVTAIKLDDGETILKCTCDIYNVIQAVGLQQTPLWPQDEELIPDSSMTCMHCHFFRNHLLGVYEKLQTTNTDLNMIESTVQTSLQFMKNEVVLLGNVIPQGSTKFSVKGKQSYSVLHISFAQNICEVKCTYGMCCANVKNKKKIPKRLPVDQVPFLCEHIKTLTKHIEYVKSLFPEFFNSVDDPSNEENEVITAEREDVNVLDANQIPQLQGNFNI